MFTKGSNEYEDLIDALMDLKHDLGKYIRMPVTMLPADAGRDELIEAIGNALHKTRVSPRGIRSAFDIWKEFVDECPEILKSTGAFMHLKAAVEKAFSLEAAVSNLSREDVELELAAVGEAIAALIMEVSSGQA